MIKANGVSQGVGFGNVKIIKNEIIETKDYKIDNPEEELNNFIEKFKQVIYDIENSNKKLKGTEAEIMSAYLVILQDPTLTQETIRLIKEEHYNAAYATEKGFNKIKEMFENIEDEYISARAVDIIDIKNRVLEKITNKKRVDLSNLPENTIIVAKELSTSDTAHLDLKHLAGIITEMGGKNSHVAIMARNNEIPTIMGMKNATNILREDEIVALNGETGEIYINPTDLELNKLKKLQENIRLNKTELKNYKQKRAITLDNHKVELACNIGTLQDVDLVIESTASGIGLFRSEFLYMDSKTVPTEEEQFNAYKEVAKRLEGKEVIIRTLDIGGDKDVKGINLKKEENPFLGYRAIRICLEDTELFKKQLRAILRASKYGNLSIMLPMISSIEELRESKKIIEEVKKELQEKNIEYKKDIKVGIMIEVPSSALIANSLAKECDFFSIGTNDLIQYTVAAERGNEKVADLYTKFHPAIIKLIKMAIDAAHQNHITCGLCGEAAGDERYIPLLIGLGLDEFSMNPRNILKTKKIINHLRFKECKVLANKIIGLSSANEVRNILEKFIEDKKIK